jgi:hypothetical protein
MWAALVIVSRVIRLLSHNSLIKECRRNRLKQLKMLVASDLVMIPIIKRLELSVKIKTQVQHSSENQV